MRITVCFILCAVLAIYGGYAEVTTSVDIMVLSGLTRNALQEAAVYGVGKAALSFNSTDNPDVRAGLELDTIVTDSVTPDVKRAFIKARFPGFRVTAGKTRESWGEGFLFNAGDVIFGSLEPVTDLSQAILRDETVWLLDLYLPLGQFSHLEAIVLPYAPDTGGTELLNPVYEMRGGGRVVTKVLDIKLEGGYIFKADRALHQAYISLQGNLYFDLQLSASMEIPVEDPSEETLKQGLAVTFGLFRIFSTEGAGTWTLRVEGALRPFAAWQEETAPTADTRYGLLVYPELDYAPADFLVFQLRSIISPLDGSALISLGLTYNVYQGLSVLGTVAVQVGDENDVFGWGREGDLALLLGLEYIF